MTIREQFLIVQKDVIDKMDKRFVDYLINDVEITFKDQYPQKFEHSLLSGTFNSNVLINDKYYSPYSDEFYNLTVQRRERIYFVKYSFLHNYTFTLFCNYFEVLANGLSNQIANPYLEEFEFFLSIQVQSDIDEYKASYISYWREILLRVIWVLENGNHSFYNRYDDNQRASIITEFKRIEKELAAKRT